MKLHSNERNENIANRLREVYLNGCWIANTNYRDVLFNLNWKEATQKVGPLNTIADLTCHIAYYLEGILAALETGTLQIHDAHSFNHPPILSEGDWEKVVANFIALAEQFVEKIAQMEDNILDEPFVDEKYGTYQRNFEGVIEHSYYHLGQIVLLKKLIEERKTKNLSH